MEQVRTIRAWRYFQMNFWYGGVPLITDLPQVADEAKLPRDSEETVKQFVYDEIDTAIDELNDEPAARGRIAKGTALAIKMRSALYWGDLDRALSATRAIQDLHQYEIENFRTNDAAKPETSFAVINDIHGRTADIPALLKVANYPQKDMVFFNGDMLSQLRNEEELFSGFMDVSIELFAKQIPMYYARGNHETRGLFATYFQDYFSPKEPHLYYMFRQGPVCFIVLDTGEDKPDTDIEYSGITDYDNYRTEQAEWLKTAVQSEEFLNAKFRVVIAHMPPQPIKELWHGPQEVLEKFVPILNQAGIDVMLSGHLHRYIYCKPDSQVQFPVVINSKDMVIDGQTQGDKLQMEIRDTKGALVDKIVLTANRKP